MALIKVAEEAKATQDLAELSRGDEGKGDEKRVKDGGRVGYGKQARKSVSLGIFVNFLILQKLDISQLLSVFKHNSPFYTYKLLL